MVTGFAVCNMLARHVRSGRKRDSSLCEGLASRRGAARGEWLRDCDSCQQMRDAAATSGALMHPIIRSARDASGSVSTAIPTKFIARESQVVCAGR